MAFRYISVFFTSLISKSALFFKLNTKKLLFFRNLGFNYIPGGKRKKELFSGFSLGAF
jgi:hypothetical protein